MTAKASSLTSNVILTLRALLGRVRRHPSGSSTRSWTSLGRGSPKVDERGAFTPPGRTAGCIGTRPAEHRTRAVAPPRPRGEQPHAGPSGRSHHQAWRRGAAPSTAVARSRCVTAFGHDHTQRGRPARGGPTRCAVAASGHASPTPQPLCRWGWRVADIRIEGHLHSGEAVRVDDHDSRPPVFRHQLSRRGRVVGELDERVVLSESEVACAHIAKRTR